MATAARACSTAQRHYIFFATDSFCGEQAAQILHVWDAGEFKQPFRPKPFTPATFSKADRVAAFARIDAGSTSTKGVLLSTDGDVLCKAHQLSKGNPIQDTIDIFEELRQYERVRREQIAKEQEFAELARRQHEHIKTKRLLPLIDHRFDHGAGERAVQ
jgi:activator of 2-hydroxyglutaryl-CoA dehydratase